MKQICRERVAHVWNLWCATLPASLIAAARSITLLPREAASAKRQPPGLRGGQRVLRRGGTLRWTFGAMSVVPVKLNMYRG